MDLDNPYLAPTSDIVSEAPRSLSPKSWKVAVWRGAKIGVRWGFLLITPFALLMLLFSLGLLMVAAISPRDGMSFSDNPMFYLRMFGLPFEVYLIYCLYGAIIGAVIGGLMHMTRGLQTFLRRRKDS